MDLSMALSIAQCVAAFQCPSCPSCPGISIYIQICCDIIAKEIETLGLLGHLGQVVSGVPAQTGAKGEAL
jgi:hypothetical protein